MFGLKIGFELSFTGNNWS